MRVTKDNFAWVDVTAHAKNLWGNIDLYILLDDDTASLIQYEEEIDFAIKEELPICIEGGYLNAKIAWDKKTHRIKVNGYWYTKISDTNLVIGSRK